MARTQLTLESCSLGANERYIVGLCGIPGSGKSSLASQVVTRLNTLWASIHPDSPPIGVAVGMDGWHYSRAQLDQFPDPQLAHDRRGAPWTFDGQSFSQFVVDLKSTTAEVWAPGFSHSEKDPVERGLRIDPTHKVVVVEGNYCNVDEEPWLQGAQAVNERWLLRIPRETARERLIRRHVLTGVAPNHEVAVWRAENNDLPNGDWLLDHVLQPYRTIESRTDPVWSG